LDPQLKKGTGKKKAKDVEVEIMANFKYRSKPSPHGSIAAANFPGAKRKKAPEATIQAFEGVAQFIIKTVDGIQIMNKEDAIGARAEGETVTNVRDGEIVLDLHFWGWRQGKLDHTVMDQYLKIKAAATEVQQTRKVHCNAGQVRSAIAAGAALILSGDTAAKAINKLQNATVEGEGESDIKIGKVGPWLNWFEEMKNKEEPSTQEETEPKSKYMKISPKEVDYIKNQKNEWNERGDTNPVFWPDMETDK
jgi:hypothetical protein